ncbi:mRNA decay activator protein ZFP36L2-like [Sycon ciliatum]|uniref:mRNA decay activator protein ZFP36L2-like n=1 Tax=Sycon ciliatum TaxID=27933 RepID=UPI0031F65161
MAATMCAVQPARPTFPMAGLQDYAARGFRTDRSAEPRPDRYNPTRPNSLSVSADTVSAEALSNLWTPDKDPGDSGDGTARGQRSNSSRYKTELCRPFMETGSCRYGEKCQFAHGAAEQRAIERHPKYKTEACRTFYKDGFCPYGSRCHFVHEPNESRDDHPTTPSGSVGVSDTLSNPVTPLDQGTVARIAGLSLQSSMGSANSPVMRNRPLGQHTAQTNSPRNTGRHGPGRTPSSPPLAGRVGPVTTCTDPSHIGRACNCAQSTPPTLARRYSADMPSRPANQNSPPATNMSHAAAVGMAGSMVGAVSTSYSGVPAQTPPAAAAHGRSNRALYQRSSSVPLTDSSKTKGFPLAVGQLPTPTHTDQPISLDEFPWGSVLRPQNQSSSRSRLNMEGLDNAITLLAQKSTPAMLGLSSSSQSSRFEPIPEQQQQRLSPTGAHNPIASRW